MGTTQYRRIYFFLGKPFTIASLMLLNVTILSLDGVMTVKNS